jgi:hypothetical protein
MTLAEASLTGTRLHFADDILAGRYDIDRTTFTISTADEKPARQPEPPVYEPARKVGV